MGFLRPKMPPPPPPPPPAPDLPPATPELLDVEKKKKIAEDMAKKKKGYTETIMTSTQGDTSTPDLYKKTLLGG